MFVPLCCLGALVLAAYKASCDRASAALRDRVAQSELSIAFLLFMEEND
jgi:hypothetical protein